MEAERVFHDIQDIATRLISLDSAQYGNTLDQYFEDNVNYESRGIHLQGLNEFKKYLNLGSIISYDSHLIGQPTYDEANKVAKFSFSRTIYLPTLPSWIPAAAEVNKVLNKQHFRPVYDTELHLTTKGQEDDEGIRYVVSKVGPTERRNASFIEQAIPYLLLRPFITFFVLVLANITGFFQRHPHGSKNPFNIALSAVAEGWAGFRNQPIDREHYPETIKQAQDLTDKVGRVITQAIEYTTQTAHSVTQRARGLGLPVDGAQHVIELGLQAPSNALHTASNVTLSAIQTAVVLEQASVNAVQSLALNAVGIASGTAHLVEDQAKDLGVPVDEYRELAVQRAHNVGEWFGVVKAKAQEQGQQVIQATQQGVQQAQQVAQAGIQQAQHVAQEGIQQAGAATQLAADVVIDVTRDGAEQAADLAQQAAQAVKDNAGPVADQAHIKVDEITPGAGSYTSNDASFDAGQGGEDFVAKLTTGGHDPTALGAPSYAGAVQE